MLTPSPISTEGWVGQKEAIVQQRKRESMYSQLGWQGDPISPVPAFRASSGPHPGALGDLVFS